MRLDQWLFENDFFDSREKARREILAGYVREKGSGRVLDKPGMAVPKNLQIELFARPRFVGRGGEKLEGFLKTLNWDVTNLVCLDVGSSTGGFTDCLLQSGAKHVFALDVGTNQLDPKLRSDPRVTVWEETDAREVAKLNFHHEPELVVVDVAFISIRLILGPLLARFPNAKFIFLFKPQFEVGRFVRRKKSGVVYEEDAEEALSKMLQYFATIGFNSPKVEKCVLKGAKGNQEYFIAAEMDSKMGTKVPRKVFRTYDIRGVAGIDLSPELFEGLGYVLGNRVLRNKKSMVVGVGRDARESSPELFAALVKGLSFHAELELIDLGVVSTPMVYYASHLWKLGGAFQITASHNPKEDNGIKMMLGQSTMFGDQISLLADEIEAFWRERESLTLNLNPPRLQSRAAELEESYIQYHQTQFAPRIGHKLKVVIDCANGMTGLTVRRILTPFVSELEILFEEVDCRFPNHEADPTVAKNLQDLIAAVKKKNADVGFSFDGDGDRLGMVTAAGRIIYGDEILMLLAEAVLKEKPGSTIIGEVKCSQRLFTRISDLGGTPIMYRTGHSLIKEKMKESGAPLAGEMSGHLFFADRFFGFDDGIYAMLRVLEVVSQSDFDFKKWLEAFPPTISTPEWRITFADDVLASLVANIKKSVAKQGQGQINDIDGIRVSYADASWFLLRLSNTQPVAVIRIEAPSQKRLQELRIWLQTELGVALPEIA